MRTNIKRIDMLKILLLAEVQGFQNFCYIIILRVAKQLIQLITITDIVIIPVQIPDGNQIYLRRVLKD